MANLPNQDIVIETTSSAKQNYTIALIVLAVLYLMMGFITCLNDTLVPFFKAGFVLNYTQSSLVQFYFFLTYGIMSIPAGKIVEKIGYKNGMVTGFGVAAFGAILFYPASIWHQYNLFLMALFVLAIGIVLLQVAANPYITALGPPATASSRLTLIQGIGSIGTTVAPVFGAYYILSGLQSAHSSSESVRIPYLIIAGTLILIAFIVSRLTLPQIKLGIKISGNVDDLTKSIFSFRNFNYGLAALFLYVGAEVAVGSFLTNYIADVLVIKGAVANTYVSLYWGGMLIGRLLGAVVLRKVKPATVLIISALIAIGLIMVSISQTGSLAMWTIVSVGLCNSIMFAVIFSLSVNGLGRFTPQASGLLSTAIVGGAVVSSLMGLIKDSYSWRVAFILPLLCYGYITLFGIIASKRTINQ